MRSSRIEEVLSRAQKNDDDENEIIVFPFLGERQMLNNRTNNHHDILLEPVSVSLLHSMHERRTSSVLESHPEEN